jgi:hypothetical protein
MTKLVCVLKVGCKASSVIRGATALIKLMYKYNKKIINMYRGSARSCWKSAISELEILLTASKPATKKCCFDLIRNSIKLRYKCLKMKEGGCGTTPFQLSNVKPTGHGNP